MTQSPQQIVPCDTPVDEEPCPSPSPCEGPKELLILAAKTADLLTRKVEVLIEFLKNSDAATLRDISYTLATVTPHEDVYRVGCLASNKKEAIDQLSLFATRTENTELPSSVLVGVPSPNKRKLVLLFSGQGPQWFGMGRGLFETNRIFRESMIELNAIHKKLDPEVDFVKAMFSSEEDARINETRFLQPRFVAEQMSLAEVVKAAELPIDMIVGHSLGETGACHVCGSLTKEEAMLVMHERCRAQYELNGKGTMAVIKLPRGEVLEAIKKYSHIGLAGENSTLYHNVAGPCEEVWQLVEELSSTGVFAKGLGIDEAMHSYQVEWKRDQLLSCLAGLVPRPPSIPIVSTFTPLDRRPIVYNAEYWYSSLKAPVEFRDALLEVFARLDETHSDQQVCVEPVFVELDAFPILRLFVDELGGELGRPYRFVETLQKDKFSDRDEMLRAFGELFVLGFNPNFGSSLFVSGRGRKGEKARDGSQVEEGKRIEGNSGAEHSAPGSPNTDITPDITMENIDADCDLMESEFSIVNICFDLIPSRDETPLKMVDGIVEDPGRMGSSQPRAWTEADSMGRVERGEVEDGVEKEVGCGGRKEHSVLFEDGVGIGGLGEEGRAVDGL